MLALVVACGGTKESPPVEREAPVEAASDAAAPVDAPADGSIDATGPMAWLDPKANGVALVALPDGLSPQAIASVFALPPRAASLLAAPLEVDDALASVIGEPATTWFSGAALVTTSLLSQGPTVVRQLAKPRAEITAALQKAKFSASTTEGFEIWLRESAFGWRVVMLDDTTVAFVPMREPGSGLSPLTAGRDMPPSDLERELTRLVAEDPTLRVALYSAGPMLHFDIEPDLRGARLELRTMGGATGDGIDGRVLFEPEEDTAGVAAALGKRQVPEETEQIRLLASQVGWSVDGELVLGRLQVPATKIAALRIE